MSKNLDKYWHIEYQLQALWSIPHHKRDYTLIATLGKEHRAILDSLREEERRQLEDAALTTH